MSKKYNLILGRESTGCIVAYFKTGYGNFVVSDSHATHLLSTNKYQFTQDEIDKLKESLPTKEMRDVVDASKVELQGPKVPLYYMQSKRLGGAGTRIYFTLMNNNKSAEDTNVFYEDSFDDFLCDMDDKSRARAFLTKEEWEPYLTPDRELVKYEPNDSEDD